MRFKGKLWLVDEEDKKFFGQGTLYILEAVEEVGSLNKACKELKMSYSKGFAMIKKAEKVLGKKLLDTEIGGAKGGGSQLTPAARGLMTAYREANEKLEKLMEEWSNQLEE